jgi:hypothetical protein
MAIWYILWLFGISYGYLVYFTAIWYIILVLVCCDKKNMATLVPTGSMFGLGGIRYRGENIMRLSLDRGGRTTRDYEGPQVEIFLYLSHSHDIVNFYKIIHI